MHSLVPSAICLPISHNLPLPTISQIPLPTRSQHMTRPSTEHQTRTTTRRICCCATLCAPGPAPCKTLDAHLLDRLVPFRAHDLLRMTIAWGWGGTCAACAVLHVSARSC